MLWASVGQFPESCEPGLVEIWTVLGGLFLRVATDGGPRRSLGVVASTLGTVSPSGSVSGSV